MKESVKEKYVGTKIRFPMAGKPYTDAVIEDVDKYGYWVRVIGGGLYEEGTRLHLPHESAVYMVLGRL